MLFATVADPTIFFLSVVLFQVHAPGITLDPFEGDTPRAVDRKCVALGFPAQGVEPKAGDTQVLEPLRLVKHVQEAQHPFLVVRSDTCAGAVLKQVAQALMAEALDHKTNCSASRDICKPWRDTRD